MNFSHPQAQACQQLFSSYCEEEQAMLLPGCWGGDYGANQLAWLENPNGGLLLLGVLTTRPDEDIQLDTQSLGGFTQLSPTWLRIACFTLRQHPDYAIVADNIERASMAGRLTTVIMVLDVVTEAVRLLPVRIED